MVVVIDGEVQSVMHGFRLAAMQRAVAEEGRIGTGQNGTTLLQTFARAIGQISKFFDALGLKISIERFWWHWGEIRD